MGYDFNSLIKQQNEANNRDKFYTDFEDVDPNVLHQISDLTEWIRTKGKGSDVREVIAQLFERTWLEATKEGNSNMELAKARGMFNFLYERLANIDAQLLSKADASEIATQLQNMASASPKGTYANLAALKAAKPSGDTGIYITTDNKHWNYWNGSSWVSGGVYQASAVSPVDTFAFVSGREPINFNHQTKTIEIVSTNTIYVNGKVYTIVKENVPYSTTTQWIVVDTQNSRLSIINKPTSSQIVVGALFTNQNADPTIYFNGIHTINGAKAVSSYEVTAHSGNIIYSPDGNIIYDSIAKTLTHQRINVQVGNKSYWLDPNTVELGGNAGFIALNKATLTIQATAMNSVDKALIGYYDHRTKRVWLNSFQVAHKSKKIACLGDSITEGVHANGWQWHRYIDQWCKNNGIESTVVNLGIGGTLVSDGNGNKAQAFVRRLETIPEDADVVVIFGGTNDWGNSALLGTVSDTGTGTFYGAYKHILEWLALNRPNAKVLTITPLKRYYRGSGTIWKNAQIEPNNKGNVLGDFVRAVKEVSELYAVPCVDLHNESGLNPVLEIVRTKYIGDGLHPTAEGNKRMYPIILDKLRPLLEYD